MTDDLLTHVRRLKTQAKNLRDEGLYEEGIKAAEGAIVRLQEALSKATLESGWASQLAYELADLHGLIGGIQRRWALSLDSESSASQRTQHLSASLDAYTTGDLKYEREERYGVVNSYNLVNGIVAQILLDASVDITEKIVEAKAIVEAQLLQKRRGDIWALADQALLRLLLAEADPESAWAEFRSLSPPDFAYDSVLDTLEPLAECDLSSADELRASIELLEADLA